MEFFRLKWIYRDKHGIVAQWQFKGWLGYFVFEFLFLFVFVFEFVFVFVLLWSTRTDLAHGNVKGGLGLSEARRHMHAVDIAANNHDDHDYNDDDDNCHL